MTESIRNNKICISLSDSLYKALVRIEENRSRAVFVLDDDGKLVGSITDGDIRRTLIDKGPDLQRPIKEAVNRNVRYLNQKTDEREQRNFMRELGIEQLPLVDDQMQLVSVVLAANLFAARRRNTPVVLMAGGLGKRLGNLTKERPKPLVMLDDKPIMEHVLLKFRKEGFSRFFISVNHMRDMVYAHFNDGSQFDVEIEYLSEDQPLGTGGALSLIKAEDFESIFVTNCDVICQMDYGAMLDFHEFQSNQMTLGVINRKFSIPFGVIETVSSKIIGFQEKPSYEVSVNAGVYVLDRELIADVPSNQRFDMPELVDSSLQEGKRCAAFIINEEWIDVGHPDDLERAQCLLKKQREGVSYSSKDINKNDYLPMVPDPM